MRIRTRQYSVNTVDIDGTEFELEYQPAYENYIIAKPVGDDHMVIGYLVYDHDCRDIDDMLGDGMGKLLSFHRHSKTDTEALEALGRDRYGEPRLDLIWGDYYPEVCKRYIEMALNVHSVPDILNFFEESGDYGRREGETPKDTAKRYLQCDLDDMGFHSGDVAYGELMGTVLEQMFNEPEYFPGNVDAVILDCYQHGSQHWSISGGGMQCRWDTTRGAGVWVPDDELTKCLDSTQHQAVWAYVQASAYPEGSGKSYQLVRAVWDGDEVSLESVAFSDDHAELCKQAKDIAAMSPTPTAKQLRWGRQKQAEICCQQFLDQYNAIINGDVYGCVVETFHRLDGDTWEQVVEDACWGFVTSEYAMEALASDFVDPAVKAVEKEARV